MCVVVEMPYIIQANYCRITSIAMFQLITKCTIHQYLLSYGIIGYFHLYICVSFHISYIILQSADMDMEEDVKLPFHFTTHCFYMAHHCLSVGLVPVLRRYERLALTSRRVQILVQRIQMSNDPSLFRALEGANVHLNLAYTLRAHLLHPQLIEVVLAVYGGTADWLSQQVLKFSDPGSITTGKIFPVTDAILCKIQHLPESLVSCLANFAMFLKKFYIDSCHISDKDCGRQFVTFISIFLGSNKLIRNPHLRAELVELLSLLIPQDASDNSKQVVTPQDASDDRKQAAVLKSHKLASDLLIRVLLQLFVDIENSGDNEINLAFKFNYRLPIYDVLKYLWPFPESRFPEYQKSIDVLCKESHTETEPPVFLKFLNLMVDDSTLLLDLAFEVCEIVILVGSSSAQYTKVTV